MKQLIIVGAGGMGRTMYDMARESIGYGREFLIKGFIDDNMNALDGFKGYPSIIGSISSYVPEDDDIFICSIGGESRKSCIQQLLDRKGHFLTMIHKTARIGSNVQLGEGNLVGAFTTIAADAKIGNYNFIQSYIANKINDACRSLLLRRAAQADMKATPCKPNRFRDMYVRNRAYSTGRRYRCHTRRNCRA